MECVPKARVLGVGFEMSDRSMGALIVLASLAGLAGYFYLVFLSPWALMVIQVSAFLAVAAVLVIVAWVGYTMATTPPPGPLDVSVEEPAEEGSESEV